MTGNLHSNNPMTLSIGHTSDALLVPLKVVAGASRDAVVGLHNGRLKVSVRAAPEKGRANKAVIALLARALDVPKKTLAIAAGATSPEKTLSITADTQQQSALKERIEALCQQPNP